MLREEVEAILNERLKEIPITTSSHTRHRPFVLPRVPYATESEKHCACCQLQKREENSTKEDVSVSEQKDGKFFDDIYERPKGKQLLQKPPISPIYTDMNSPAYSYSDIDSLKFKRKKQPSYKRKKRMK